jgi:K+-sensing histidine kinase KdpD
MGMPAATSRLESKVNLERTLNVPYKVLRQLSTTAGILVCVILAVISSLLLPQRAAVPLLFIGIVFAVAYIFGSVAGMLGALASALVFAYFSSPAGSFRMANASARSNLEWLLLVGIPASYLLVPDKDGFLISRRR